MKDEKKSIMNEALIDYKEIMEAASQNAKNKLAADLPEKFNNLLKEEILDKKKSKKELVDTDNVDDEINNKKENDKAVMKNKQKEVVKENVNNIPFTTNARKVAEDFNVTGQVGSDDEDEYMTLEEIERELDDFDAPEGGEESDEEALETPDEEEAEHEFGGEEFGDDDEAEPEVGDGDVKAQLLDLKLKLDALIDTLGGEEDDEESFEAPEEEPEEDDEFGGEELDENDFPSDDEINNVLNGGDDEIEESHGLAYPQRRNATGRHTPNNDYLSTAELDQEPYLRESKKINGLIKDNKSLTKKVNELAKNKKETDTLVEKYKVVLNKYRTQLNEMAIFNTNLAHVNNLLVNEDFALTQRDKVNIINGFKTVKNINESEQKYKSLINEFKNNKNTIVESIENKVVDSIQPSSMSIVEKTVYSNDSHMNKIRRIIEKVEHRDKKLIK